MTMNVHFLRTTSRVLFTALVMSSFASCSVYFSKEWREVKPKIRKRYYIPENSDKVSAIRYEVFHAKTGKDMSTRFRARQTHFYRGNDELLLVRYIDYTDGKKGVFVQSIAFENQVFGLPLGTMAMGSIDLATKSWNRRNIDIPFVAYGMLLDFVSWMPALAQVIGKSYISFIRPLEVPNYPTWLRNHLQITLKVEDGFQQTGQVYYYVR
jgi:hypothetical protein